MSDARSRRHYAEGEPDHGQGPYRPQYQDPYAQQPAAAPPPPPPQPPLPQGYGYDPHTQQYYPYAQQPPSQQGYGYGPHAQPQQAASHPQSFDTYAQQQPRVPPQAQPADRAPRPDYRTEQFSFIEERDDDSDDVIDWLKFAETRSERRDERKRKGRKRVTALVVALVLALVGGVGYLWYSGKLPGLEVPGVGSEAAGGAQKRDVIVVHLRNTKGGGSSTALLVDNETAKKGTTVLLPNILALATDEGGSTTLGKSVEDDGTTPTRDALDSLFGSKIKGSWRLDTPYLENLVESVGGIAVDTDTTVPGAKKGDDPLVKPGKGQSLSGQAAVAYATYRGRGEQQADQLMRFGQVMQAVLKKISTDQEAATTTVETLAQIPDPSLTEAQLGASLAQLAARAKSGSYQTEVLPVEPDGTLSEKTAESMVKDVLGGNVENADPDATPRISVRNASGDEKAATGAQVALVNGGYTYVDGGTAGAAQATSQVTYADAARAETAKEVAKTLGLPMSAVKKGKGAANADVTVVLGRDYEAG